MIIDPLIRNLTIFLNSQGDSSASDSEYQHALEVHFILCGHDCSIAKVYK